MNPETARDRSEREEAEQERDICKGCVQYLCRCPVGCRCETCREEDEREARWAAEARRPENRDDFGRE